MDHFIHALIDVQVEFFLKENPDLKLNEELFQKIKDTGKTIDTHHDELDIRAVSMGFSEDKLDGILECHFESLELTPTSPLLTIMDNATELRFHSEEDEIDGEGLQLVMTLIYKDLFAK